MTRGLSALLLLLFMGTASAHNLRCFPSVADDGTVTVRCFFRIGQPAADVEVTITDHAGGVIFSGHTNQDGLISFTWMGPGPLTIIARDSAGHQADVIIAADKFPHSADHIPDHSDPSELAALRQKVTQLEAEIEVLNVEAARKEWTRIAAALAILLGIAGFGWGLSRRRSPPRA